MNDNLVKRLVDLVKDEIERMSSLNPSLISASNKCIVIGLEHESDKAEIIVEDMGFAVHITVIGMVTVYPNTRIPQTLYSGVFQTMKRLRRDVVQDMSADIVETVDRLLTDTYVDDDLHWIMPYNIPACSTLSRKSNKDEEDEEEDEE